jgi:hypothetical protein
MESLEKKRIKTCTTHGANRVYQGYDHLGQAANEAWHNVCLKPEKIKSICLANYVERAFI